MARLSATAEAAVLRAARMGIAQVEFPSDLAIGVRELVGIERSFSRNGITKAVMNVSSP